MASKKETASQKSERNDPYRISSVSKFHALEQPPELAERLDLREMKRYRSKRTRKMRVSESWMLETHLGGVLENLPGYPAASALTDGFHTRHMTRRLRNAPAEQRVLDALEKRTDGVSELFRPESRFSEYPPWEQVPDTSKVPFRSVCHLEIEYTNGDQALGTGWLSGPDTVITAGHNVLGKVNRSWAKRIRVIPGRNGGDSGPFSHTWADGMDALQGWIDTADPEYDLGVLKLNEPLGAQTGWFGYAVFTDDDLAARPLIQSAGYPATQDKPYGTQWYDAARAKRYSDAFVAYRSDTDSGQSGGPVFFSNAHGQRWVVATHVYGTSGSNLGRRVTDEIYDVIAKWSK